MPYRQGIFAQGQYYHIYNRGAGRAQIFFEETNYSYLVRLLHRYTEPYHIAVIAYCLMPNHYHLILRQDGEKPLSAFINVVFNAYVQAVNRQQGRTGALFEGRFRHIEIGDEGYLIHLCRYVHLNPVQAGLVAIPERWPYSDYMEWIGKRPRQGDKTIIQEYFPLAGAYRKFVAEYQHEREQERLRAYLLD